MGDVEARLQQVRARQQEVIRTRAKAEGQLDSIQAQRESLLKKLQDMGHDTPDAARERAQVLLSETEEVLAGIEAKVKSL